MDTFPDLGSLSDQELKDLIQQLTDEEQEVSYRRRILHGKIDIFSPVSGNDWPTRPPPERTTSAPLWAATSPTSTGLSSPVWSSIT